MANSPLAPVSNLRTYFQVPIGTALPPPQVDLPRFTFSTVLKATGDYFTTLAGAKSISKAPPLYASWEKAAGRVLEASVETFVLAAGWMKHGISAYETYTKSGWIGDTISLIRNGPTTGTTNEALTRIAAQLADWGMAVYEFVMLVHVTGLCVLAKYQTFQALCFFNCCSFAFSAILLLENKYILDIARRTGILHRYKYPDRPIQSFDYKLIGASRALSATYIALGLLGIPQLANGLTLNTQYGSNGVVSFLNKISKQHVSFLSQAQLICLITATALTVIYGIIGKYIEPYDKAYDRALWLRDQVVRERLQIAQLLNPSPAQQGSGNHAHSD